MATTKSQQKAKLSQVERDRLHVILFGKLLVLFIAYAIDFGSNLFYTSHSGGITLISVLFAFFLMFSDAIGLYFWHLFWIRIRQGLFWPTIRAAILLFLSGIAVILDFIATFEPVRMSLNPTTELSWLMASFFGAFVAIMTSIIQTELAPTGKYMIKARTFATQLQSR